MTPSLGETGAWHADPGRSRDQWLALLRLCTARQGELGGFKLARVQSALLAVASAIAMLVLLFSGHKDAVLALAIQALGWLSWSTALFAGMSSAGYATSRDRNEGVLGLVLQRGFTARSFEQIRYAAAARSLALLVGVPGLVLGLLAIAGASSARALLLRLLVCCAITGYSLLFGVVVAGLARAASAFAPAHGRLVFASAWLVPWALAELDDTLPSVPGLFAALRQQLLTAGLGA